MLTAAQRAALARPIDTPAVQATLRALPPDAAEAAGAMLKEMQNWVTGS